MLNGNLGFFGKTFLDIGKKIKAVIEVTTQWCVKENIFNNDCTCIMEFFPEIFFTLLKSVFASKLNITSTFSQRNWGLYQDQNTE